MKLYRLFFILISLSFVLPVWALSSDSKQPLNLESDTAKMNNNTGVSVYTGNVKVTQGSMKLLGHIVTVYSKKNKIIKIVATGDNKKQAFYTEEQDNNKGPIRAWGNTITYNDDSDTVDLQHHARVTRPGEVFTGEYIEYNKQEKTVSAWSAEGGKRRVQIVIQPKTESSSPTSKK